MDWSLWPQALVAAFFLWKVGSNIYYSVKMWRVGSSIQSAIGLQVVGRVKKRMLAQNFGELLWYLCCVATFYAGGFWDV